MTAAFLFETRPCHGGAAIAQHLRSSAGCFEHGRGMWLYDTEGQRYLDTFTGIAVCGLGHSHPGWRTRSASRRSA